MVKVCRLDWLIDYVGYWEIIVWVSDIILKSISNYVVIVNGDWIILVSCVLNWVGLVVWCLLLLVMKWNYVVSSSISIVSLRSVVVSDYCYFGNEFDYGILKLDMYY